MARRGAILHKLSEYNESEAKGAVMVGFVATTKFTDGVVEKAATDDVKENDKRCIYLATGLAGSVR
ncbi:hypothetical protein NECAME_02372 [Necator americanus]|uniref:Uncharacterized protein n=1 Tax=Necator americanus TaxID=51031 RepID=W2TG97_NECAM|nr:hypothetical protein NECAME_02372 [Necator americanus]ETN80624.1 hypothetical protein NECAME_02372 [Necator americanus]